MEHCQHTVICYIATLFLGQHFTLWCCLNIGLGAAIADPVHLVSPPMSRITFQLYSTQMQLCMIYFHSTEGATALLSDYAPTLSETIQQRWWSLSFLSWAYLVESGVVFTVIIVILLLSVYAETRSGSVGRLCNGDQVESSLSTHLFQPCQPACITQDARWSRTGLHYWSVWTYGSIGRMTLHQFFFQMVCCPARRNTCSHL